MSGYIHGGTDPREVARLEKQAEFVWPYVERHLHPSEGERVLDLATGVGAMAGQLLRHFPTLRVVGLDLRMSQLRSARANHPEVPYVNADGTALPFREGTFDRVHCSWLLEHVTTPVEILRECHRVLRPGGWAHFIEVDNSSFRTVPGDPDIRWAIDALNQAQLDGGGDPFVGQKLGTYFRAAGFAEVALHPSEVKASGEDLRGFEEAAEEFAAIFEGLDEALGPAHAPRLREVARKTRALPGLEGAALHYAGVAAVGRKAGQE